MKQDGIILTHGASSNREAPLLVAVAQAFEERGVAALRVDLAFRQARPKGPPYKGDAAKDREGLRRAVLEFRKTVPGRVFLGGHSYGGRQASMLAAEDPEVVAALLLLSYPLHPPGRAADLRTAHFPQLRTPVLFVSGSRDPFGSPDEMRAARALIPARTELLVIERAGHDLAPARRSPATLITAFLELVGTPDG